VCVWGGCNAWVYVCVGVLVICVLVFNVFLYCFVYVYLFLFFTSVRTTATASVDSTAVNNNKIQGISWLLKRYCAVWICHMNDL
jgi:hypothetical protein